MLVIGFDFIVVFFNYNIFSISGDRNGFFLVVFNFIRFEFVFRVLFFINFLGYDELFNVVIFMFKDDLAVRVFCISFFYIIGRRVYICCYIFF